MVRRRSHGADTVDTSWETTRNGSGEPALPITSIVDTLEELEDSWVGWGGGTERADFLDCDVSVAHNVAALELLGCGVVREGCVGERTGNEIGDLDVDCEVCVGVEVLTGAWVGDNTGDHVCAGGDVAHDCEVVSIDVTRGRCFGAYQCHYMIQS
jgi:hypothetical protein